MQRYQVAVFIRSMTVMVLLMSTGLFSQDKARQAHIAQYQAALPDYTAAEITDLEQQIAAENAAIAHHQAQADKLKARKARIERYQAEMAQAESYTTAQLTAFKAAS